MIVAPAVDVRKGQCVQLIGGDPAQQAVTLNDPVAAARRWRESGFKTLHLVDLDAALSDGENSAMIERVLNECPGDAQVGGGIRDEAAIDYWLDRGANRVVVGTRAVNDPDWAIRQAAARPGRILVAADVRDGAVLRRGWQDASDWKLPEFLQRVGSAPFAGILITDVGREGQLKGVDGEWVQSVMTSCPLPVWMSGGVASLADLQQLGGLHVHGVVVGMALYTGRLSPNELGDFMGGEAA